MVEAFARIPAGHFLMGSDEGQDDEKPIHEVWVDVFEMAVFPITREQYGHFLISTQHDAPREWQSALFTDDQPVVGVSWLDAQAYCAWRNRHGDAVRLPTEAEWERAARGGVEGMRYPWGPQIPDWIPAQGQGPLRSPWPVMLGEPNAYGLYGIAANIHEWCGDWHAPTYYAEAPAHNPMGPEMGVRRVSRGGAWRHALTISRTAARSKLDPSFRYTDYGFRLARSVPPLISERALSDLRTS